MLELQKNVPIPDPIRKLPRLYPFEEMQVGDFFFAENTRRTMWTHVSATAKRLGIKLKTRRTWMRQTNKGWVPSREGEPGAIYGTGVWRVE